MAILIKLDHNTRQIENRLNNIGQRIPKELQEFTHDYAKLAQRNLRLQLTRNVTNQTGRTWRSIRAVKKNKDISVVKIRKEGIWLDSAKPHWVSLKRGRLITKWAQRHYGSKVKTGKSRVYRGPRGAITGGSLWITPTPFIDQALARTQLNFNRLIKNRLKRAMKK